MKLNEIKPITSGFYDLTEGVIPIHITLTLEQVLREGKITNNVQYFVIGALIEMFKTGGPTRWPRDLNAYAMATDSALIEAVKNLSDAEAVDVAQWLYGALQRPANFESNPYRDNPMMSTEEYMNWILRGQDN